MKELLLADLHKDLGAKFMPFSGWNMPLQYTSITDEHIAVRQNLGFFDVSHMGELRVSGEDAEKFIQYVSTNDISKLVPGKAQYGLVLNPEGGVIDDIIVYKLANDDFFICANASNVHTVFDWFNKNIKDYKVQISNHTEFYSQFAIQGPNAMALINSFFGDAVLELKKFWFATISKYSTKQYPCLVARTGYSGEDGVEIFLPNEFARDLWTSLFTFAKENSFDLKPCGLGARDTLRLEAALPLHGHEIKEDVTPLSAGLSRFVSFEKGNFIGYNSLEMQKSLTVSPVLVGLQVIDSGIIRADYPVKQGGKTVGWVTSGTKTPTVNAAIGLALVLANSIPEEGDPKFTVLVRDKEVAVKLTEIPFYKRSVK